MASLTSLLPFFFIFASVLLSHAPSQVSSSNYRSLINSVIGSTNSAKNHRKWVGPIGNRVLTVDINGSGDFKSVQAAVDAVPENNKMNVTILISPGYYIEKVVVPATKAYITFQGSGREVTMIEWHDRASDRGPNGQQLRTYKTASVTVFANYFSARNISFKHQHQCQECKDGKQQHLEYQGTKLTSQAVAFMEPKTLFVMMLVDIISRIVILRVL